VGVTEEAVYARAEGSVTLTDEAVYDVVDIEEGQGSCRVQCFLFTRIRKRSLSLRSASPNGARGSGQDSLRSHMSCCRYYVLSQ